MKNNKTRVQRTPQEIILETQERLEKLQLKMAQEEAKSDPTIAPLLEQKEDIIKTLREAKKLMGEGPQSAFVRIGKHEAWISRIKEELLSAESAAVNAENSLRDLDSKILEGIKKVSGA